MSLSHCSRLLPLLVIIYIVRKETSRARWKTLND
jgi:hypothetical protein